MAWSYDSKQDGSAGSQFHGNPAVTSDTLFLGSDRDPQYGSAYIYAFDNRSGKLRWKHAVGAGTWSDVLQDGQHIYAVTMSDEVVSLDATTGQEAGRFGAVFRTMTSS